MPFLDDLPRRWITISLPGVGDPSAPYTTYQSFAEYPPAPSHAEEWAWLREAKEWPRSTLASQSEYAVADLSSMALAFRIGEDGPSDLKEFVADASFRKRLRSATDAYFDLGDEVVAVDGGRLLHLVSDSQWAMHWAAYLGDDGETAIIASDYPAGFLLGQDDRDDRDGEPGSYFLCADSFGEFAWRWWMDNEIFYHTAVDKTRLTQTEQAYLAGFGSPSSLS